jgi:hypothetical protein
LSKSVLHKSPSKLFQGLNPFLVLGDTFPRFFHMVPMAVALFPFRLQRRQPKEPDSLTTGKLGNATNPSICSVQQFKTCSDLMMDRTVAPFAYAKHVWLYTSTIPTLDPFSIRYFTICGSLGGEHTREEADLYIDEEEKLLTSGSPLMAAQNLRGANL